MNLPKFPHSAMFVGVTACGKTEFLLRLIETIYNKKLQGTSWVAVRQVCEIRWSPLLSYLAIN